MIMKPSFQEKIEISPVLPVQAESARQAGLFFELAEIPPSPPRFRV